jgi:hypothetical protein
MELAETFTRCYPIWLEVSVKFYGKFHGKGENLEVKLLRFLQEYKESLILDFFNKKGVFNGMH